MASLENVPHSSYFDLRGQIHSQEPLADCGRNRPRRLSQSGLAFGQYDSACTFSMQSRVQYSTTSSCGIQGEAVWSKLWSTGHLYLKVS